MNREQMLATAQAGTNAATEAGKTPLRYFIRSFLGGAFLFIGVFLSIMVTSLLTPYHAGVAKVAGAFVFPIGLALIVMLAGQLYTGAAFTLPLALYERQITVGQMTKTLLICLAGNLAGLAALSLLLAASGAQAETVAAYLEPLVSARLSVAWWQTLLRAILCNFYISVAVYGGSRLKDETARLIVMFFVIAGFVLSGTDHSVANGAYFLLHAMLGGGSSAAAMTGNVILAALGNFVGGAVLSALPMWYLGREKTA